jgi:8-hydroxy-5-deazaflavin:NADPH oxidoreductase
MQIGIVGSGNVGGTLGRRFAETGHSVIFGSRRPDSPEAQELARISGARVAAPREAAQAAEVIVLATPWPSTGEAVRGLGDLTGKILLDATNPLNATFDALDPGNTSSGGELVAQWAVGARVVKIFNTIGYNVMADPSFPGGPATLFYCGDDPAAKSLARDLAAQIGFDPVDAGPLSKARVLEPLALLWIGLAFGGHGREIAFRLVRR